MLCLREQLKKFVYRYWVGTAKPRGPAREDRASCRRSVDRCLNLNDLRGYLNRRMGVRDLVEKGLNLNGFGEIHRLSRTVVLVGKD